jgi:hypothetical protein
MKSYNESKNLSYKSSSFSVASQINLATINQGDPKSEQVAKIRKNSGIPATAQAPIINNNVN